MQENPVKLGTVKDGGVTAAGHISWCKGRLLSKHFTAHSRCLRCCEPDSHGVTGSPYGARGPTVRGGRAPGPCTQPSCGRAVACAGPLLWRPAARPAPGFSIALPNQALPCARAALNSLYITQHTEQGNLWLACGTATCRMTWLLSLILTVGAAELVATGKCWKGFSLLLSVRRPSACSLLTRGNPIFTVSPGHPASLRRNYLWRAISSSFLFAICFQSFVLLAFLPNNEIKFLSQNFRGCWGRAHRCTTFVIRCWELSHRS